jgi:hypothetical protein
VFIQHRGVGGQRDNLWLHVNCMMWKGLGKKGGDWRTGSKNKVDIWKIERGPKWTSLRFGAVFGAWGYGLQGKVELGTTEQLWIFQERPCTAELGLWWQDYFFFCVCVCVCVFVCVCVSVHVKNLSSVSTMTTTLTASWMQNTKTCSLSEMRPSLSTEISVFWHLTPCNLLEIFRRFDGSWCLHPDICKHTPCIHLQIFLKT